MKKLVQLILIGVLMVGMGPAMAQKIDTNRMNRDIRIMENILGELFKTQITNNSRNTFIVGGNSGFGNGNVRGTYLPGTGVIFNIANSHMFFGNGRVVMGNRDSGFSFYYSNEEESDQDSEIDEESVKTRIEEFLRDYASTIGQLSDDDIVMVIYGTKNNSRVMVYNLNGDKVDNEDKGLPVISGSVKVKDLKAFRSGKLDEGDFRKRIDFASSEDKEYLDLKVMGNIFETALREQGKDSFRLLGNVNYMLLDNFGALYSLDVRYSNFGMYGREFEELARLRDQMRRERNVQEEADEKRRGGGKQDVISDEEENKKAIKAYEQLKINLSEYVIDYGRTLSSLKNNHYVLLSVNVGGRWDDIPDRFDVQVKKEVLSRYDSGKISREEAIKSVILTEY